MKTFLAVALMMSSVSAFAASIKITSFNFVRTSTDYRSPLAELCGKVEGATSAPTFIRVQVDPTSKGHASYNTLADEDGKFCLAVITYRGTAEASIMGSNATVQALIR